MSEIKFHTHTKQKVAGSILDKATEFFNWPNPSSRTMALGSIHPLTEMSTKKHPGIKGWPTGKADNFTAICLENVGASTSHKPYGPWRHVTETDLSY
jgi:hypothetical protein